MIQGGGEELCNVYGKNRWFPHTTEDLLPCGSVEHNAALLQEGGSVQHDACIPYLAKSKETKNSQADAELRLDTWMSTFYLAQKIGKS